MKDLWKEVIITEISGAVFVARNKGKPIHKNRLFHGFVLNGAEGVKDYCFDDGRIMRTEQNCLFYLPKGSSYCVRTVKAGDCYAISFNADIIDAPFCVRLRNAEAVTHNFKAAADTWKMGDDMRAVLAMRAVYDAVYMVKRELRRQYVSGAHQSLIEPAIQAINHSFSENELNVAFLASLYGISEVYFRRIFMNSFGVSPKEYIIQKRIDYAKSLLKSGNFSVSEAALLCGYGEPCHFSREFAKRVGIPPSQYFSQR